MKLYTRRGDDGTTSLFDGSSVPKCDPRVAAYGSVDELNACLGVAVALVGRSLPTEEGRHLAERLGTIQSELFHLGADLATPVDAAPRSRVPAVEEPQIKRLEGWIDEAAAETTPLSTFILPGGDLAAVHLHVCRTVCRRAEREIVALAGAQPVNPLVVVYVNRLGDLFFAWARWVNHMVGVADVTWVNPKSTKTS